MPDYIVYGIGFVSQVLFFARTIAQWFKSEKEGEVISPVVFWQISLMGSIFMLTYGILRHDFAIVLGQFIVYFIYIRNLHLKKAWSKINGAIKAFLLATPFVFFFWLIFGTTYNLNQIMSNKDIPFLLMLWGTTGQVIFTFRFVYQWIYSENKKESVLPIGFWLISTTGSLMILVYAILRLDPVLFVAHSIGIFVYLRNILLINGRKSILAKLNIPYLNKLIGKISDKIK
jgi:lipid-A-disaccharide synthase-like uncharacterized protein